MKAKEARGRRSAGDSSAHGGQSRRAGPEAQAMCTAGTSRKQGQGKTEQRQKGDNLGGVVVRCPQAWQKGGLGARQGPGFARPCLRGFPVAAVCTGQHMLGGLTTAQTHCSVPEVRRPHRPHQPTARSQRGCLLWRLWGDPFPCLFQLLEKPELLGPQPLPPSSGHQRAVEGFSRCSSHSPISG